LVGGELAYGHPTKTYCNDCTEERFPLFKELLKKNNKNNINVKLKESCGATSKKPLTSHK